MTAEEVIDFFAPSEDSVNSVLNWLTESGIDAERIGLSVNKQVSRTERIHRPCGPQSLLGSVVGSIRRIGG